MTAPSNSFDFQRLAREEMLREKFQPDFPPPVTAETNSFHAAAAQNGAERDLRDLLWSTIDNTESRDLDQAEWAEQLPDGKIRVRVGVADVDAVVGGNSATDVHARANATSVYTGGPVFPMLPERLSTDLTSLGQGADRRALIMEFVVGKDGVVACADVWWRRWPRQGEVELRSGRRLAGKTIARRAGARRSGRPGRTTAAAARSRRTIEGASQRARLADLRRRGNRADCCQ